VSTPARVGAAVVLALLALPVLAGAADPLTANTRTAGDGPAPAADIALMAWLAGTWRGDAFEGIGEEAWLAPADGAMVGSYRYTGPDGVGFYELLVIREVAGSLELRLKHFDADLHGWEAREETVDFPLVAVDDNGIHFDGMTFVRRGPDAMTVFLALERDGVVDEVRFDYRRVD
jgi:hypothetical protein